MDGMRETKDPVIGLTIQLQKYGLDKLGKNGKTINDLMLGHYDSLLIQPITQWLQFSPGSSNSGSQENDISLLVTHYPIKLLFPEDTIINGVLSHYNYQAWKEPNTLLSSKPCMALALVNLTDTYKEEVGDRLLIDFANRISSYCNETGLDLGSINCCILPSIGYSDFCILMADDNWKSAMKLIEGIHALKAQCGAPLLSTDYLMPVYHKSALKHNQKLSKDRFAGVQLSIRVNLMPGCTAQMLANCVPDGVSVYRTSGGSDCLLCADSGDSEKELFDFMLQRRAESGNFVLDMASTLKLRMEKTETSEQPRRAGKHYSELLTAVSKFEKVIDAYEKQLLAHKRHTRQANSLRELAGSIRNICVQRHTADLRKILVDFLEDYSHCISRCTTEMQAEDFTQYGTDIFEIERSIGKLCAKISSFLADLSRSDCFHMEREKYNHPSVSSATSLLLSYNHWLNSFTDSVQKTTQPKSRSDYAFMVTSGGCDQTRIFNAFYFLEPQVKSGKLHEKVPLLIQMSEMSLYDFSGTIMRAVHECMHYCGDRKRKERLEYIVRFVVYHLAAFLSNTLFDEISFQDYAISVLELHSASLADDTKRSAQIAIGDAYEICRKQFEDKIVEALLEYFPSNMDKEWQQTDYLIRNVREWIFDQLFDAFSGHEYFNKKLRVNSFAAVLYKGRQDALRNFLVACDSIFQSHHVPTMTFMFETKKLEAYLSCPEDDRSCEQDPVLYKIIQMVLARLLITDPSINTRNMDDDSIHEWNKVFPFVSIVDNNIRAIVESTADIFSESFADVTACQILNAELEDYILMHVYEDWDLDDALSTSSFSNIFRIPAVLKICFPGALEKDGTRLTMESRDKISTAISRLTGHGMPEGRLDANSLCDRIDTLVELWHEQQSTGDFLLEYLTQCQSIYTAEQVSERLSDYASAFQKIRLLSIDPGNKEMHKNVLHMFNALEGTKMWSYENQS